jgi:hypothetical protein
MPIDKSQPPSTSATMRPKTANAERPAAGAQPRRVERFRRRVGVGLADSKLGSLGYTGLSRRGFVLSPLAVQGRISHLKQRRPTRRTVRDTTGCYDAKWLA